MLVEVICGSTSKGASGTDIAPDERATIVCGWGRVGARSRFWWVAPVVVVDVDRSEWRALHTRLTGDVTDDEYCEGGIMRAGPWSRDQHRRGERVRDVVGPVAATCT